jgi:NTE family protein
MSKTPITTSTKKPITTSTKKAVQSPAKTSAKPAALTLDLALQGGGSHGAYTWGVLDRLLEEPDLIIQGISGTSAGAMNGAVLVSGFELGGAQGARSALDAFWHDISAVGEKSSPLKQFPWEKAREGFNLDNAMSYRFFESVTHMSSPYEWNPMNLNPLRKVVEQHVDFAAVQRSSIQLFVAATHVASGQAKVFHGKALTVDAVLASACLPTLYQAVEIDGEAYWDGGYMGNPVLWPLIYNTPTQDLLLVQVNPLYRAGVPKRAYEISNRLNEISFNSSLIAELRAVAFVQDLLAEKKVSEHAYKNIFMHLIEAHTPMADLDASSKVNVSMAFLLHLKAIGRSVADEWLNTHKTAIGKHSSVDIKATFLNNGT